MLISLVDYWGIILETAQQDSGGMNFRNIKCRNESFLIIQ